MPATASVGLLSLVWALTSPTLSLAPRALSRSAKPKLGYLDSTSKFDAGQVAAAKQRALQNMEQANPKAKAQAQQPSFANYLDSTSTRPQDQVEAAKQRALANMESTSFKRPATPPSPVVPKATPPPVAPPPPPVAMAPPPTSPAVRAPTFSPPSTAPAPSPAGFAGLAKWDPQAWVVPAMWNTGPFRSAALLTTLAAVGAGTRQLGARAAAFSHLASFGVLFGSMVYTTFFAGMTMFKNLPRQTFGRLQSKLFPMYFKIHAACLCVMIGTIPALAAGGASRFPLAACLTALAFTVANIFYIEPASTKVMFQRYELENAGKAETEEYKQAAKKFGPLHGLSSLANLGALMAAMGHSWWLGGRFLF